MQKRNTIIGKSKSAQRIIDKKLSPHLGARPFASSIGRSRVALAIATVLGAVSANAVHAATINVNSNLDNTTAGDNSCTLREALANSNSDSDTTGGDCKTGLGKDVVKLKGDTYLLGLGELVISDDVSIRGKSAGMTVVDANNTSRVFLVNGADAEISKLTITGGHSPSGGGVNVNSDSTLTLTKSTITGNHGVGPVGGGGLLVAGGAVVKNSLVTNNTTSAGGGGVYTMPTGSAYVSKSTISNNSSGGTYSGGGVVNRGHMYISKSTVTGNTAGDHGAGIENNAFMNVVDSDIVDNHASSNGGGIRNVTQMTLINSSVLDNSAGGDGGGIYNKTSGSVPPTLFVVKSDIARNSASTGGGILNDGSLSVLDRSKILLNTATGDGGGILDTDILFVSPDSTLNNNTPNDCVSTGGNCP